jgi:hypothetical protein
VTIDSIRNIMSRIDWAVRLGRNWSLKKILAHGTMLEETTT